MGASTGPIVATGAIALFNETIVAGKPINLRIVTGTAIAAGGLVLIERLSPELARGFAWLALLTILLVRIDPAVPAPTEAFNSWYNGK
jgi:hypothetical protein